MDPPPTILPGGTIGMVGGGQLGRMFATAAAAMGYRVAVFCESHQEPAAQVANVVIAASLHDQDAIDCFANQCDVITLEFENIPAATIARCHEFAPTFPSASVLATAQDRMVEKSTLRDAGLPVTPFAAVHDTASLVSAGRSLGWPLIVKTARSGYDGKGQQRVDGPESAAAVDWQQSDRWVAEQWIGFEREVSAIVARSGSGECQLFPIFENEHRDHILDITKVPAAIDASRAARVGQIAIAAAETLGVVGLLCVEFFVCGDSVMINEVAPRPHNSGHLTIEACETSQFSQHVRAVCNLPLGSTALRAPAAAMANLLGDLWRPDGTPPDWREVLREPEIALHLYGKQRSQAGRKMGHLTITGQDPERLAERLREVRHRLAHAGSPQWDRGQAAKTRD